MLNFVSEEILKITGRGTVAVIDLAREENKKHISHDKLNPFVVGNKILLNGEKVIITAIEAFRLTRENSTIGVIFQKTEGEN